MGDHFEFPWKIVSFLLVLVRRNLHVEFEKKALNSWRSAPANKPSNSIFVFDITFLLSLRTRNDRMK